MSDNFQNGEGTSKLTQQGLSFSKGDSHFEATAGVVGSDVDAFNPTTETAAVIAQYNGDDTVDGLYLHGGQSKVVVNASNLHVQNSDEDNTPVFTVAYESGNTVVSGTLGVTGAVTLDSGLTVSADGATVTGDVALNGGTLNVSGAATLQNTLGVTGAVTLDSTLSIHGNTYIKSCLSVGCTLDVAHEVKFDKTLNVSGATTLQSTLGVTGAVTFDDELTVSGAVKLHNDLSVAQSLNVETDVRIQGSLSVQGSAYLPGLEVGGATELTTTDIEGTLSVSAQVTFASTLSVHGDVIFENNLSVGGKINCVEITTSSDAALKTNIRNIEDAEFKINNINGVEFDWIHDGSTTYGLVAQDIEEILPHAVKGIEGSKKINYNAIVGLLVEAVKEQSDRINELENMLNNN